MVQFRGDGGNHQEKLGFKRNSCARQFTIPDTAGTSPDPVDNYRDTRSSKPNQASRTSDFSYPLISCRLFSSWSPNSLFLVHNSTILARTPSYVIPLYFSMPSSRVNTECRIHRVWHILSMAYTECSIHCAAYTECSIHRVQHTPSAAYTECSIHRVQHTPSAAYTECSIHRVQHKPSAAYTECSIHRVQHTQSKEFT